MNHRADASAPALESHLTTASPSPPRARTWAPVSTRSGSRSTSRTSSSSSAARSRLTSSARAKPPCPRDETNAIISAVKDGYAAIYPDEHLPIDDIKFTSVNRIPPARGLGSSSAALVAGLAAGLALAGQDLAKPQTKQLLLQLAADAEGHPDNVAPAIYGGFQVSINTGKQWVTQAIGLPKGMQAVLFIPEFESLTSETRRRCQRKFRWRTPCLTSPARRC